MSRAFTDFAPQGRDEQAAEWCMRLAEAPLAADEHQAFDAWMLTPANARAFEEAVVVWQGAEVVAEKPELLHIRVEALESYRRANKRRWSLPVSGRWYGVAGVAGAILLVVMTSYMMLRNPMQIYETSIDERRVVMLDDGSRLSLDAATSVHVRLRDDRRELRLTRGRAKFDVAKSPLRPFSVLAGDKLVVATGTSFSVELLRRQVRVMLYEGHVSVLEQPSSAAKPRPVRLMSSGVPADQALTPGRELVAPIATPIGSVVANDMSRSLSWEAGQLSFENEPLSTAVERVNRYRRQKLVIADQATANLHVNGVFTAGDDDAFIEGVAALYPVQIVRANGQVTLKRN